jgi:hypothetical protein
MATDTRVKDLRTEHLFDITVELNAPLDIGDGPYGRRTLFGAAGGSFTGPKLRGEVLPVGGDWALFRPDGVMSLDVRLTLRTHDDALLQMTYLGRWVVPPEVRKDMADRATRHLVDPARYYFRTAVLFETGAQNYAWLNDIVCVGSGHLIDGGVAYQISRVI